jgi:tripartite-type tricarboxylate transporter receptor subunit TctC
MAERMRASLGQSVIVENVVGANGSIAVGRVARATPDGYTLSIGQLATHVTNGATYALQYDLVADFEPISLLTSQPFLIVGKKAMPANDLNSLIAWLKANPDKASAGIAGVGSPGHIISIFFQNITGTRFQFVPYRGGAPAIQDLVAGQIDLMITDPVTTVPQVQAGTIKAYAVAGNARLSILPKVPTVGELGLSGVYAAVWHGLRAPRGTPKDIITKLNGSVVNALGDRAARQRLADIRQEIYPRDQQTPEALAAFQKAEIEKCGEHQG